MSTETEVHEQDRRKQKCTEWVKSAEQTVRVRVAAKGIPRNDIQDVVQEVLLSIYRFCVSGQVVTSRKAIENVVTKRRIIDYLRKQKHKLPSVEWQEEFAPVQEETLHQVSDIESLRQALRLLNAEERCVVIAKLMQGLSWETTAAEAGIPLGTARRRLASALSRLRRTLESLEGRIDD